MLSTLTKSSLTRITVFIFITLVFCSCQKELNSDNTTIPQPPDLTTKISSSVSGFVTDENNAPVQNAAVQFGTYTTTTDKYGYFEAKNVQVVKDAAFVTITKTGYFKGIKTYMAKAGKGAFFRIKLIPKTIAGTINSASGGSVTLASGLVVTLPAGAVVNATTNAAYTGTVNVSAYRIDPIDKDFNNRLPGDQRGVNTGGILQLLKTFGIAAVELTGASGELLQIANGKKATLTMPIPAALSANTPSALPLWYFDETAGLWKEQGTAVKNGNSYSGDVSHFSYWFVGLPGPYVQFDCTIRDAAGYPLQWAAVIVTVAGNSGGAYCYGYTDSLGNTAGFVPANSQLQLDVWTYTYCNPIYSQNFTTTTTGFSLGTIVLPPDPNWRYVSGKVVNCNNSPVTAGAVIVKETNYYFRYNCSSTGNFFFSLHECYTGNASVDITGMDSATMLESSFANYSIASGNNNIGNIIACNNNSQEFFNYTINNVNYTVPYTNFSQWANPVVDSFSVYANANNSFNYAYTGFTDQNIGVNSVQNLYYFACYEIPDATAITSPIAVHITEYGNVGQFVSGNFSGVLTGISPPNNTYNITASFRTRRYY